MSVRKRMGVSSFFFPAVTVHAASRDHGEHNDSVCEYHGMQVVNEFLFLGVMS